MFVPSIKFVHLTVSENKLRPDFTDCGHYGKFKGQSRAHHDVDPYTPNYFPYQV